MRCARDYMLACFKGVPLLPLYMRGAGLQGRFPSRLRVEILVGYNCISCYTRKVGSYPYTVRSFLWSCAACSPAAGPPDASHKSLGRPLALVLVSSKPLVLPLAPT